MLDISPFDLPADPETEINRLTDALRIVRGFALYFVVCDPLQTRPRLMNEIEERLPKKRIQRIVVPKGTRNLLHLLEQNLADPLPDVVFVYGLENTISGSAAPRSHELLLNLNATRNNFFVLLPRPIVFWVPSFIMTSMLKAAPDFISVRSGVYTFALSDNERRNMSDAINSLTQPEVDNLSPVQREVRIIEMENLLTELRSLPESKRNPLDEAAILNQLGFVYYLVGRPEKAEHILEEALAIRRENLPEGHIAIADTLNNLGLVYHQFGELREAQEMFQYSLAIYRKAGDQWHESIVLNNLGMLFNSLEQWQQAERAYLQALAIKNKLNDRIGSAQTLNNLGVVYRNQERWKEAENVYKQALDLIRTNGDRVGEGASLNNLAVIYENQGRLVEAESLYRQAFGISTEQLGVEHPHTLLVKKNLEKLQRVQQGTDELRTPLQTATLISP